MPDRLASLKGSQLDDVFIFHFFSNGYSVVYSLAKKRLFCTLLKHILEGGEREREIDR